MKEANIDDSDSLELRDKINSVIASHILNRIFKDKEKRYPLISLVFNTEYNINHIAQPFYILSENLSLLGFNNLFYHIKEDVEIHAEDLENLYIGMYLIGGGDPHGQNIFYNSENHYLGSVDLDISFKEHISFFNREKEKYATSHSDLAIKPINCDDLFVNFMHYTDSKFKDKKHHYQENILLYKSIHKMDETRLRNAVNRLRNDSIDNKALFSIITSVVGDIKKDLKEIINTKLQLDAKKSIYDSSGDYFDKDSATYKEYKGNRLIKAIEFLFDENEHYVEKVCEFVENRYLSLIYIFGSSDDILFEPRCLSFNKPTMLMTQLPDETELAKAVMKKFPPYFVTRNDCQEPWDQRKVTMSCTNLRDHPMLESG